MNEVSKLSHDLNVITAEINSYKSIAGQAIFEIGKRLKHVKENDLAHGQYVKWLESIEMDRTTAHRFIKVADELNVDTWQHLSSRALYEIATMPKEEREKTHVIPSTGEEKTVDEMTVRELREVKKALKEAEAAKKKAEAEADQARRSEEIAMKQLEEAESGTNKRIQQLQSELQKAKSEVKTIEIEKEVVPPELKTEIELKDREIKALKDELKRIDKAKKMDEQAADKELKYLNFEANKTVLSTKIKIDEFLKDVAITAFRKGAIAASSDKTRKSLEEGIGELENFCEEMRFALNGRIDLSKRGGQANE